VADALDDIAKGAALIGIGVLTGGTAFAGLGTVFTAAGTNVILGGIAKELTTLPKRPKATVKGNITGGINPMKLVFGTRRVGGQAVFAGTSGTNNEYFHYAVAHSLAHSGGISDITDLYIDTDEIADANIDGSGEVTSGTFTGYVNIRRYLGTSTQVADTTLDSAFSTWASTAYLRGVAYTAIRCQRASDDPTFQDMFPRGFGFTLSAIVKGCLCYDPRLDSTNGGSGSHRYATPTTWAYSANPALIAATYAIMETTDGGCGLDPATEIDWTSVATAASICDETRTVPDGASGSTTEARYECHIVLDTQEECEANLSRIVECMAGEWAYTGGQLKVFAGAYTTPTVTIDEDWLRGSATLIPKFPLNERYNAVKVSFANKAADYREEFAEPYTSTSQETADNGQTLWKVVNYSGVTGQYQAQYLRNIIARRGLMEQSIRAELNFRGFDLELWQTVNVSWSEPGVATTFRVVGIEHKANGPNVELAQDAASVYTSTYATDYTEKNPTSTPAVTKETPATTTGLGVAATTNANVLTWTPGPEDSVTDIYASDTSGGTFVKVGETKGSHFTERVSGGTPRYYKTKVRRRNSASGYSSEVTATSLIPFTGTASIPDWADAGTGASTSTNAVDLPGYFGSGGGDGLTVPYPTTGVAAGETLIMHIAAQGGGSTDSITIDTPSGWTALGATASASGAERSTLFWKRAAGTESGTSEIISGSFNVGGTPTHNASNVVAGRIYRFTGVLGTGTPYEGHASTANAASTTIPATNITTSTNNALACQFVFIGEDEAMVSFTGEAGADYTEATAEYTTTTGGDIAIQLQIADVAVAGAITGGSMTIGTSQVSIVHGLALKPAA
jgi:hypothetical protein